MTTPREQAVERQAAQIVDMLRQARHASMRTADTRFRNDVLRRVTQILRGELRRYEDLDD